MLAYRTPVGYRTSLIVQCNTGSGRILVVPRIALIIYLGCRVVRSYHHGDASSRACAGRVLRSGWEWWVGWVDLPTPRYADWPRSRPLPWASGPRGACPCTSYRGETGGRCRAYPRCVGRPLAVSARLSGVSASGAGTCSRGSLSYAAVSVAPPPQQMASSRLQTTTCNHRNERKYLV